MIYKQICVCFFNKSPPSVSLAHCSIMPVSCIDVRLNDVCVPLLLSSSCAAAILYVHIYIFLLMIPVEYEQIYILFKLNYYSKNKQINSIIMCVNCQFDLIFGLCVSVWRGERTSSVIKYGIGGLSFCERLLFVWLVGCLHVVLHEATSVLLLYCLSNVLFHASEAQCA